MFFIINIDFLFFFIFENFKNFFELILIFLFSINKYKKSMLLYYGNSKFNYILMLFIKII